MSEFCKYERHGGICVKTGTYCNLGVCPYEQLEQFAQVVHGRCPICSGQKILTQDCDNGYSVEVDAEFGEMSIWQGDTCLTVISIDYCPNCGAKLDGGAIDG